MSSERFAKKPKIAQPILTHFSKHKQLNHHSLNPNCDLGSQSPVSLNEFLTLSQQESAEPQQISPQPSIQIGQDFNSYLVDKETHCHGNQKLIRLGLPKFHGYFTMQVCICAGVLFMSGV